MKRNMDLFLGRYPGVWLRLFGLIICLSAGVSVTRAQSLALKTNALGWATASLNIEPEIKIGQRSTLALGISWNPWTIQEHEKNRKWKHLLVRPEYRYWFCAPFSGHFVGVHPLYVRFNVGNVNALAGTFPDLEDSRLQGNAYGAGIGYGYHWILGNHWSIEAEVGVGLVYADYDRYWYARCGRFMSSNTALRFLPTKLSLSVVYVLK